MRGGSALRLAASAALAAALLLVAAGLAGPLHPALDSFAHFRAHLSALGLLLALVLLATGGRAAGAAAALAAATALATVAPAYLKPASAGRAAGDPDLRLLHLNLRFDNPTPDAVLSLIESAAPDVVALNEVSTAWRARLEPLTATYPFHVFCNAPHRVGGAAVLARRPWAAERGPPRCLESGSLAIATLAWNDEPIDVVALHLHWPWPYGQAGQITRMEPVLRELGARAIVVGDFNAVRWSAAAARIADASGARPVGGYGPTWLHGALPRWLVPLGLAIDLALTRGEVGTVNARTLGPVGSDHLPVLLEFTLPRRDGAAASPITRDGTVLERG